MEAVSTLILTILVLVILLFRKQGVNNGKNISLLPGERLRPIKMQLIEPLIEFLLVGVVLWVDISSSSLHLIAACIGVIIGILFGLFRARIMYVRAEPTYQSIVLTRSTAEYLALALLLVAKILAENNFHTTGVLNLVITGLLALVVAESTARSISVYLRYQRDVKSTKNV